VQLLILTSGGILRYFFTTPILLYIRNNASLKKIKIMLILQKK
jgi:hypothetical protein